jgi:uncharacterized membrane protein YfcA
MSYIGQVVIVCPLVFLAGFIDSVAGGGGLLSTPAFMLAGIPMHNVLATNKVMASTGTSIAAYKYIKNDKIQWETAIVSAIFSFVGSFFGSRLALSIDQILLKKAFTVILPFIALFVLLNKPKQKVEFKINNKRMLITAGLIGLFIGMYDGLIGPGTGTFLIFAYTAFLKFDYINASGNAKIINLSSNIAAAISFIIAGKVLWRIAIPAAIRNVLGNYLGAGYALKNGSKAVKKMLIFVLVGIFVKLIIDVF